MRAHTVILGAGATIATIPNGDKNGRKSSVMNGLIKTLNLEEVLNDVRLKTHSSNLEDIYSELYSRTEYKEIVETLENKLYEYFSLLEIPDYPTIYDYLILSLTEKDVIATFNWDPLLLQAYVRCVKITDNLPKIFCLHGNVAMSYCYEHNEYGYNGVPCPICHKIMKPTKLLYPVSHKSYNDDLYIKNVWEATQYIIDNSYMLTIFGYSAPASDVAAMKLLKNVWGGLKNRQLEEVSIIDILDRQNVVEKWNQFIYSHHYRYSNNFFDSYLGKFPRRSCETVFGTYQFNLPPKDECGFKENMSWEELKTYLNPILREEVQTQAGQNYPLYFHK